jgi:hypothetical protein
LKHIIYALVDPTTHQVRYVGQTGVAPDVRLRYHVNAAGRGINKHAVYEWMRGLKAPPLIVVLQDVENAKVKWSKGRYENTVKAAETKWMKRFERYILNSINRDHHSYTKLTNPSH